MGMVLTTINMIEREHLSEYLIHINQTLDDTLPVTYRYSLKGAQKAMEAKLIAKELLSFQVNKNKASKALKVSYPSILSNPNEYYISED